jgi:streptomycin 6-kinase
MLIPQSLREGVIAWMPDGQQWADSLPALVEHAQQRWGLTVGEPFEGGCTAWVAPAECADGSACVLKLPYPEDESWHESDALRMWDGDGAVRLLGFDADTRALLLERVRPGAPLANLADPEEAFTVACSVLRRLWRPAAAGHPFATAVAYAAAGAAGLERKYGELAQPFDVALLRAAVAAFEELTRYEGDSAVLHQDFHRGNVLRAEREPWLAIDPKPLAGERAFDARWLLYNLLFLEPRSPLAPAELLDRLAAELAVEPERIRLWTVSRAFENALWCYETGQSASDDVALAVAFA